MAGVSSAQIMTHLATTLDTQTGHAYHTDGDVDAALAAAAKTVTAEYHAPYLAHAAMEPISCTVLLKDGRATVWASTQVPGVARHAAAKALGISADDVDVKVQFLGGGFGRRLDVDFIGQAAAIAKVSPGVPVQTLWSREEDIRHDFYRPATVSRFMASLDAKGALTGLRNTSAGQALVGNVLDRYFGLPGLPIDKTTSEGAFDQPYEYPASRIAHQTVALPVPVGFWRAVGHSHQAFFTESFLDEVAHAAGKDPVAFRLALLSNHPRHARVLSRVASLSAWNTPLPAAPAGTRIGRGVALHESFGSVVAHVAEVSVNADNTFRVTRITGVIDCGTPVNPNLIRQQMEGGIIFGMSAALHGEITIENGQVKQANFNDYPVVRMQESPVITVDIMPSAEHPQGVGEPPLPPVAPAIANALFAATGQRIRTLPLRLTPPGA
jgi:isoquinoline 1-oxidoreductase beta subunit